MWTERVGSFNFGAKASENFRGGFRPALASCLRTGPKVVDSITQVPCSAA